jgi:DNA repair protein RAD50
MNELTQKGRYQAEMESFESVKKRRNNLIVNLKKKYIIINNKDDINEILEILSKENYSNSEDLQNFENISLKKENEINEKINNLKSKLYINKENQKNNSSKYSANNVKYNEYNIKLKSNEVSKQEVEELMNMIKEKESIIKLEQTKFDKKDYQSQIKNKEKELIVTKETFRNICDEIAKMHANSKLEVQYSITKDRLNKKEVSMNELKNEYQKNMKIVYNKEQEDNKVKSINNNYKKTLNDQKIKLKDEIDQIKNHLASTKTRLSISETSFQKSSSELERNNEILKKTCGDEDLKEVLKESEKVLLEKQDILANISSAKIMYTKFIAKSKKSHSCPLCIKKFENQEEDKFVERLEKIIQKIPETIEKAKAKVEEELKKREKLRSLEPLYLKTESLKNNELVKLKEDINKYQKEILELDNKLIQLNKEMEQLTLKEKQFKEFEESCYNYENALNDYKSTENELNNLKNKLNKIGSNKDLDELQKDQQLYQNKSDELQKAISEMHNQYSTELTQLQKYKNELLDMNEKLSNLNNKINEYGFIKISMDNLLKENENIEQELKKLKDEEKNIENKINVVENELFQVKQQNNEERLKKTALIKELKESIERVNSVNSEIKSYKSKNIEGLLQQAEQELIKIDKELKDCQSKILEITNKLSTQNEYFLKIQVLKREIEDNIKYRTIQNKLQIINQKKVELESKISHYDKETYSENLRILYQKREELLNEKATISGELKQLEDRVRQLERELTTEYKNVDEDYIKSQLKLKTDEMAYDDLDKYSKALDNAIMHYHSIKMEEINRTIQELWVQTYQGSDIDTIEIRGEKELSKSKVKSYNYRVVMLKDGKEINMRGRCSSGQKVLASLIIRLALAESFCINCGILALDEPTTNLDKANIESLAESLTMLIKHRRKQSNFQLVIITHDESFVQQIGKSEFASYYYRISKDINGHSRIVKNPISSL